MKSRKQLAKIYYQNREVKYINIIFEDLCHSIYIGSSTHISGKHEIITMNYDFTPHDDEEKEYTVSRWQIRSHLDKLQVNHIDSGIMIEWLSNEGNIKSSSFIPMERILHINVDTPQEDYEVPKGIIER